MIIKWINNIIDRNSGSSSKEATQQGAIKDAKRQQRTAKMIDVPQRVMESQAAQSASELEGLRKYGAPQFKREKLRRKVRSKVWDIVRSNFDTSDDEMVEEITERIVDVADADPYFAKMFGDETNNVS